MAEPQVVRTPSVQITSLIARGSPWSGPASGPRLASAARAAAYSASSVSRYSTRLLRSTCATTSAVRAPTDGRSASEPDAASAVRRSGACFSTLTAALRKASLR